MKYNLGKGMLFSGLALVVATAIRALADLMQADRFDPWSVILAVGCVSMSIGLGLLKKS